MILLKKELIYNITLSILVMCMAWALKYHYSIAQAEHLKWILTPTALMVESITGHLFNFETGTGYINHDIQIIIAPVCAGINFLIAVFCMSVFCGIFRLSGFQKKCFWMIECAAGAYITTIYVNAFRIWISITMISADIHAGWFTPQRLHRMIGILIYFFFLSAIYHIIQKIICHIQTEFPGKPEINISRPAHMGILPLIIYWITAIAVPWLNSAYGKDPSGFTEHSLTVGILSLAVFIIFFLIRSIMAQIPNKSDKSSTFIGIFQKS